MTTPLPTHLYTLQDTVRHLVKFKGMTVEDALEEMEKVWRTKFTEELKDMVKTDINFGGRNGS